MTNSRYPEITDELLSAYIDNAVTERERQLVERAVAEDADIAWRLTTLQETVRLLRTLPPVRLPRAFLLTPEQAAQGRALPALPRGVAVAAPVETPARAAKSGFWERLAESWGRFWRAGSPALRNAMATSMALLFALIILPLALSPASPRFAAQEQSAPLAAPVAQLPAPTGEQAAAAEAPAPAPETAASKLAPASEADVATGVVTMDEAAAEPAAPESEGAQAESLASPAEQSVASVPAGEADTAPSIAAQAQPEPAMREGAGAAGAPEMGLMAPAGVSEGYPGEAQPAAPPGVAGAIPPEAFGPAAAPALGEAPAAAIVTRATPTAAPSIAVAVEPESPEEQSVEAAAAAESAMEEPALAESAVVESPSAAAASAEVAVAGNLVTTQEAAVLPAEEASAADMTRAALPAAAVPTEGAPTSEEEVPTAAETAALAFAQPTAVATAGGAAPAAPRPLLGSWRTLLPGVQALAAVATLLFGLLWWRSRQRNT